MKRRVTISKWTLLFLFRGRRKRSWGYFVLREQKERGEKHDTEVNVAIRSFRMREKKKKGSGDHHVLR